MEQNFDEDVVVVDAVTITKKERKKKDEAVQMVTAKADLEAEYHDGLYPKKVEVSATDLIATLYTYAPSPVKKGNFKQAGKCLLCGVPTAAVERKICWECINKHRDDLTVI